MFSIFSLQFAINSLCGKGVGYYQAAMTHNRLMKVGNTSMAYIRLAKVSIGPFPRFVMVIWRMWHNDEFPRIGLTHPPH
jgi:hypothetical protein